MSHCPGLPAQQSLALPRRGGARAGAGRPATLDRPALPHAAREEVRPGQPVHVTLRFTEAGSERSFAVVHGALTAARTRWDARITHFSIQGNHVHLVVEAAGTAALSNAVRSLSIRLAKRLNRMMGRQGPVFEDRFHAHVLRTPAEVRNALRYVVGNFASHAARRDEPVREGWVDPYSSAAVRTPRTAQPSLFDAPAVRPARTWLLRSAARSMQVTIPSEEAAARGWAAGDGYARAGETDAGRAAHEASRAG